MSKSKKKKNGNNSGNNQNSSGNGKSSGKNTGKKQSAGQNNKNGKNSGNGNNKGKGKYANSGSGANSGQAKRTGKEYPRAVVVTASVIVLVLLVGILGFAGWFFYKKDFRKERIITSESPDKKHRLVISTVGEPDFPFGKVYGCFELYEGNFRLFKYDYEAKNDGKRMDESNYTVNWSSDFVQTVIHAEEQEDLVHRIYFDGQYEIFGFAEGKSLDFGGYTGNGSQTVENPDEVPLHNVINNKN